MKYTALACAAIMGCVLMSGKIDVNIEHNMHLPKQLTSDTTIYTSYKAWPLFSKRVDIYLQKEIKDMGYYVDISRTLNDLNKEDEVYFHLAGYGGNTFGMTQIVTAIKNTTASVTMLVEAPIFSAHTMLATLPNVKLVAADHTFFMFHHIEALNKDCWKKTDENDPESKDDRGQPESEHCQGMVDAVVSFFETYLKETKFLTEKERNELREGHDLWVPVSVIRDRQNGIFKDVTYTKSKPKPIDYDEKNNPNPLEELLRGIK